MYLEIETPEHFAEQLAAQPRGPTDYWLIMLSERHLGQLAEIVAALNAQRLPFFGIILPGLLKGRRHFSHGAIARAIPCLSPPVIVELNETGQAWRGSLPSAHALGTEKPLLYVFIDCLSPDITGFLNSLFDSYGNRVNYFGGGTGNSRLNHKPALFDRGGAYTNAAVVAVSGLQGAIGVRHGHERIDGPFIATRTDKNVIQELNWEPIMDVYRRALPPELRDVSPEDFFARVTPTYPFGIYKAGREDIVRDPIRLTESGELVCLSDVPAGSAMYLMHGDPDQLIDAARQAAAEVIQARSSPPQNCMICDCFSRMMLLDDAFPRELAAASEQLAQFAPQLEPEGGVLMGEIASDGEQSLEFYNKTFVVSVDYD